MYNHIKTTYKLKNGYLIIKRIKFDHIPARRTTSMVYIKLDDRESPVYPIEVFQGFVDLTY